MPMFRAFGVDLLRQVSVYSSNIRGRVVPELCAVNQALVWEFLQDASVSVPYSTGELDIWDSKVSSSILSQKERIANTFLRNSLQLHHLDRGDIVRLFPPYIAIAEKLIRGGTLYPQSIVVNPQQLTHEYARRCVDMGVQFKFTTQVLGIHVSDNQVTNVTTNDGDIVADQYVVAAGISTGFLVNELCKDKVLAPIIPVKSYMFAVRDSTDGTHIQPNNLSKVPPTFFPSYPTVYLHDSCTDDKSTHTHHVPPTVFPSSVLSGEGMITLQVDPTNQRLFRLILGAEFTDISSDIKDDMLQLVVRF
uniref:D-amino acid dehydrogenase small subunit n=1 Tax=Lygus hesperus TaxID=30085 RepID=A0A0A9XBS4_LYGHE